MALVAPVLVVLLFGMIEFGIGLNDYQSIRHGVREGARQAVVQQYGSAATSCTSVSAPDEVKKVICLTKDRIGIGDDVAVFVRYYAPTDVDDESDHGAVLVCAQRNVDPVTGIVPGIDGISLESSILMKMEKEIGEGISTAAPYQEAAPAGQDWSGC